MGRIGHDDVTTWTHFRHYWLFVKGIWHWSPVDSPSQRTSNVDLWCSFFDFLHLNKLMNKQSSWQWLEMTWHSWDINVMRLPCSYNYPDSKVHGANMGPTWVLSAPGGPHVGPMNLAIREMLFLCGREVMYCGDSYWWNTILFNLYMYTLSRFMVMKCSL